MCLITDKNTANIAEKDIICFKLYKKSIDDSEIVLTPFEKSPISALELKGIKPFLPKNIYFFPKKVEEINSKKTKFEVSSGYIHTYKDYTTAKKCKDLFDVLLEEEHFIAKCIIPKKYEYFEGIDSNGFPGYASDGIIFQIENYEVMPN
jgi:hypothetical protein